MLSEEEIKKAKESIRKELSREEGKEFFSHDFYKDLTVIMAYIKELEESNKELDHENNRLEKIEFERDNLKYRIEAKEKVHEYDINMIDEVKGRAVKLYKIIDEMALYIAGLDVDEDICKHVDKKICDGTTSVPVSTCQECIRKFFEKKVEGK